MFWYHDRAARRIFSLYPGSAPVSAASNATSHYRTTPSVRNENKFTARSWRSPRSMCSIRVCETLSQHQVCPWDLCNSLPGLGRMSSQSAPARRGRIDAPNLPVCLRLAVESTSSYNLPCGHAHLFTPSYYDLFTSNTIVYPDGPLAHQSTSCRARSTAPCVAVGRAS